MSGTVDYVKVVDLLTDTIKELNLCVEAPAVPAERAAAERKQIAADVLRELLHELEGGGAAGAGAAATAADVAAEHGASADKWNISFRSWPRWSKGDEVKKVGDPFQKLFVLGSYWNETFKTHDVSLLRDRSYTLDQCQEWGLERW